MFRGRGGVLFNWKGGREEIMAKGDVCGVMNGIACLKQCRGVAPVSIGFLCVREIFCVLSAWVDDTGRMPA